MGTKHNLPVRERIERNAMPEPNSGCWLWMGYLSGSGRPVLSVKDRDVTAARLAYQEFVSSIPEGGHVLHKCDNPMCVNPDHLWVGSHKDNMADRHRKGRDAVFYGEAHPGAKHPDSVVRRAMALRNAGLTLHQIQDEIGVSFNTVHRWVTGRNRARHNEFA